MLWDDMTSPLCLLLLCRLNRQTLGRDTARDRCSNISTENWIFAAEKDTSERHKVPQLFLAETKYTFLTNTVLCPSTGHKI